MTSNIHFVSKNSTQFGENPLAYFGSPDHQVGYANVHNRYYLIKKFIINEHFAIDMLPEVKILDNNFTSQYLVPCRDYIIEQEKTQEYTINRCLYIVNDTGDEDLYSYISKNGPLDIVTCLKLLEAIVNFEYSLQKELDIGHGDIKPSNIFIRFKTNDITGDTEPEFRISFFDNHNFLITNTKFLIDSLAFQSPETLVQKLSRMSFLSDKVKYQPSEEVFNIMSKNSDEIKYNPSKSDTFSLGLVLLYAATGYKFVFQKPTNKFEIPREGGTTEPAIINYLIGLVKQNFKCDAFVEILRTILNQSPYSRFDFEELAIRINKLNETNKAIPFIDLEDQNTVPMEDYESLKESYFEVREQLEEAQQRIRDLEIQLKAIRDEKQRKLLNLTGSRQMHELSSILHNKNEISSFLSDLGKESSKIEENDSNIEDDKFVNEDLREIFPVFELKDNTLMFEINTPEESKNLLEKFKTYVFNNKLALEDVQIVSYVTDQGLKIIGESLKKLSTLSSLIISFVGQITDQGLEAFASNLKELVKMEYLQLDIFCKSGYVTDDGLDAILSSINLWSELKEIKISIKAENSEVNISKEKCTSMEKKIIKELPLVRKVEIEI